MTGIPSIGAGLMWKLGTGAAALVALVLGFFLITSTIQNHNLSKERDKLSKSISDPDTGYIARLTQSRTNVITLQSAIDVQNKAFKKQSDASAAELVRLKKELATAQANTRAAQQRLDVFLATKPQGATLADRVTDIDNRVLEDLRK